ncbi:MAG: site-specific DNA-methyltransferase [Candidatus Aenigmarchaeota archaeon]|nr:site-specific DNA-methyltransferase [Candidatus Aenigmarchaeota archaeon]
MKEIHLDDKVKLYYGDVFECLEILPKNTIQTIITSPTYWGKRQFTNDEREFGKESLEQYIHRCVSLFSNLLDLIKENGSLFFIMQDSRMGSGISRTQHFSDKFFREHPSWKRNGNSKEVHGNRSKVTAHHNIIKNTSWCGIPFKIANELVDKGYIWRDYIIWEKPNPMPDKIVNRVRQSAEYVFHFVKNKSYKYNPKEISVIGKSGRPRPMNQVWTEAPNPEVSHSATFSPVVVERLLKATTDIGDWVFDPFVGSGTLLKLCLKNDRRFIGCDINSEFTRVCKRIITSYQPLRIYSHLSDH